MNRPLLKSKANSRSDLLTLLTEACELEHGLACSYLYAAFSLKQDLSEGGMTWQQLHMVKRWASQIYMVAAQEMFHLSQAWNIINAIGGTPYYMRPNFPQPSSYYPLNLPLSLEPFSERTIKRFTLYELPRSMSERDYLQDVLGFRSEELFDYRTVGELYDMIASGISSLDEKQLFIGEADLQMDEKKIDFPEMVRVVDKQSALSGINKIIEQGEGNDNHVNSHYGIFVSILKEFKDELASDKKFDPVRNAISNPVVNIKGDYRTNRGNVISDELTAEVADIFDDIYNLMLRTLHFVFSSPELKSDQRKQLAKFSIALMPMIVKPLGDVLAQLPAGRIHPGKNAGPAFSMSRHVTLPHSIDVSRIVINERFDELANRISEVSSNNLNSEAFRAIATNINRLRNYL